MLPLLGEVHVAQDAVLLVSTGISVSLGLCGSSLVGGKVELDVQLGAVSQRLVHLDPELGVPCLRRIVGRLHDDATALVLACTCHNGCGQDIGRGSLLGDIARHIVTSQVTVGDHARPAIRSNQLVILLGSRIWNGILGGILGQCSYHILRNLKLHVVEDKLSGHFVLGQVEGNSLEVILIAPIIVTAIAL